MKFKLFLALLSVNFLTCYSAQSAIITSRQTNSGTISIDGDTYQNINYNASATVYGGALFNNSGTISLINEATFQNNKLNSTANNNASGGAIFSNRGSIGSILGSFFIGNEVTAPYYTGTTYVAAWGGAISISAATLSKIENTLFQKNKVHNGKTTTGGAIALAGNATITNLISSTFDENSAVVSSSENAQGGAIYIENGSKIINIVSNVFKNNLSKNTVGYAVGGAISSSGNISLIEETKFNSNSVSSATFGYGGAISSMGSITKITLSEFKLNKINSETKNAYGGAIYSQSGTIGSIHSSVFDGNSATSASAQVGGGAIYLSSGTITKIESSTFSDNFVDGYTAAAGGALRLNGGTIGDIINTNFTGNYAIVRNSTTAYGGAVYGNNNLTFTADNYTAEFTGNYVQISGIKSSNAIHMTSGKTLNIRTKNDGTYVINDGIFGSNYTINFTTVDGTGAIYLRGNITNAANVNITNTSLDLNKYTNTVHAELSGQGGFGNAGSTTNVTLNNANLNLHNDYYDNLHMGTFASSNSSVLHINIGKNSGVWTSDLLNINGDITGETGLIVYSLSEDTDGTSVVFAKAPVDNTKSTTAFSVLRVYGSPLLWIAQRNIEGNEIGSVWYLTMTSTINPDYTATPEPPTPPVNPPSPDSEVVAEIISYRGLHSAALDQTHSMVNNIRSKVAANKVLPDTCLLVKDEAFDGDKLYNAWINPIYHTANIDKPVKIEADIWGVEAGFDVQANQNHKIGVFASYRQGEYDLSGKGKRFFATVGSEIDIDSYIAGLYYRYDYRHLWAFATLYGGIQKADIKTDDGIKADTDGTQIGASLETGYLFNLSNTLKLEPSLGAFYTQIDFDDINDSVGKTAKYDTIRQIELEAGIKLEKYLPLDNGIAKVYIKPSIIQVITSGDKVRITGFNKKLDTYEDGTLGRVELGGRYAITDTLSTYGWVNYTFGSDYDATSLGIGLNYSW